MFEYMKRTEYKETSKNCRNILKGVQNDLRDKFKINIHLIGSAKSRLMMKNGNGPYDFDYSLEITKDKTKIGNDPRKINEVFLSSFNKFLNKYGFSKKDNSTRVIKLKSHSKIFNNHIEYSMEVAIIMKKNNKMNIIIFDKEKQRYIWNEEEDITNLNKRFRKLRKTNWIDFKNLYKEKKNNNLSMKVPKKSISLFKETINEIENKNKRFF